MKNRIPRKKKKRMKKVQLFFELSRKAFSIWNEACYKHVSPTPTLIQRFKDAGLLREIGADE